jgi:acylphosphatase
MSTTHCIKCRIRGRVQGVWFRVSTQTEACQLDLKGYAHNLRDGSVDVLACGSANALANLRQWLQHGPTGAQVEHIDCKKIDPDNVPEHYRRSFTIGQAPSPDSS